MNSVIILFINDLDELIYDILVCINQGWCERVANGADEEEPATGSNEDDEENCPTGIKVKEAKLTQEKYTLAGKVQHLEQQVQVILKNVDMLMQQNKELKILLSTAEEANPAIISLKTEENVRSQARVVSLQD
jgi:hypothetical protein